MNGILATVFIGLVSLAAAGPHHRRDSPDVYHDQRQEGDVNVHADLDNFLILVVPSSLGSGLGFLDILKKGMKHKLNKHTKTKLNEVEDDPKGLYHHKIDHVSNNIEPDFPGFSRRFLESKLSPYSIDLTSRRKHLLQRVFPEADDSNAEVIIAESPIVLETKQVQPLKETQETHEAAEDVQVAQTSLSPEDIEKIQQKLKEKLDVNLDKIVQKLELKDVKNPKKILIGIDQNAVTDERVHKDKPEIQKPMEEKAKPVHDPVPTVSTTEADKYADKDVKIEVFPNGTLAFSMQDKNEATQKARVDDLVLLGAVEQCGHDRYRDSNGVCQFKVDGSVPSV